MVFIYVIYLFLFIHLFLFIYLYNYLSFNETAKSSDYMTSNRKIFTRLHN